jgi:hypothetical protein
MDQNLIHANPVLDEVRRPIYSWSVIYCQQMFSSYIFRTHHATMNMKEISICIHIMNILDTTILRIYPLVIEGN